MSFAVFVFENSGVCFASLLTWKIIWFEVEFAVAWVVSMANSLIDYSTWDKIRFSQIVLISLGFRTQCENKNCWWWVSISTLCYLWVCAPQLCPGNCRRWIDCVKHVVCSAVDRRRCVEVIVSHQNRSRRGSHETQVWIEQIPQWK